MGYPPTFVDMQNDVIANLRLEDGLDRNKVKDWLNASYMEAVAETEFWTLSAATTTLAANTSSVTVPAALLGINYIVATDSNGTVRGTMELKTLAEILDKRGWSGGTLTQGAPQMYAYVSSATPTVEIWPTAVGGEVLTFYGFRLPNPLSADADVMVLPEPYGSNIVVNGSMALAAQFKQNIIMLSTYQQEGEYWTQRLRALQNNRGGDKVQQLQVEGSFRPVPPTNAYDTPYAS
jgi:hypothetical protein